MWSEIQELIDIEVFVVMDDDKISQPLKLRMQTVHVVSTYYVELTLLGFLTNKHQKSSTIQGHKKQVLSKFITIIQY